MDSRRKLVHDDVVREVSLCCRGARVGGEVQEDHLVSMHVLDGSHIDADFGEVVEGGLLVSLEGICDSIV